MTGSLRRPTAWRRGLAILPLLAVCASAPAEVALAPDGQGPTAEVGAAFDDHPRRLAPRVGIDHPHLLHAGKLREHDLDALAYYYHGAPGSVEEKLQAGFIIGHSLLTARGVPCAGEGDLKTALAMKICDLLDVGGSFTEIVVVDYVDGTVLLGHDGPFHVAVADGRPLLRGMGLYHGKQGTGVSVEAKVRAGPVTTLNVTQTANGRLKLISSEGTSTDGPTMKIGNTQTPIRFDRDPDEYMSQWFAEAPTHHCAMSVGTNARLFEKVGALLGLEHVTL